MTVHLLIVNFILHINRIYVFLFLMIHDICFFNVTEQWIRCRVTGRYLILILTLLNVDLNTRFNVSNISGKVRIGLGFFFFIHSNIIYLICWEYILLIIQVVFNTQCEERGISEKGIIMIIYESTNLCSFSLMLRPYRRFNTYQLYGLWIDPIGTRTHNVPHSTWYVCGCV